MGKGQKCPSGIERVNVKRIYKIIKKYKTYTIITLVRHSTENTIQVSKFKRIGFEKHGGFRWGRIGLLILFIYYHDLFHFIQIKITLRTVENSLCYLYILVISIGTHSFNHSV